MSAEPTAPLRVNVDAFVGRITLTRPDAANTISMELALAFDCAVADLHSEGVRVIVIEAEGPTFSGGGDIRQVSLAADPAAFLAELANAFHRGLARLREGPAIVITAVQGAAAGGGLGFVLHSDIAIAGESARFLTAYDRLGLTPDSGVSDLLPLAIGARRAMQLSVTGGPISAATALEWGLVAEIAPDGELHERVASLAARIAAAPVDHLVETRRLMTTGPHDHRARLDEEAHLIGFFAAQPIVGEKMATFGLSAGSTSS